MQRRYEFMDLIVTIGLCASIVTGGLLFMVTTGSWPTKTVGSESMSQASGSLTGMDWVQPVLGQTIVDHTVLERNYTKAASAATIQLDGLILERNRWQNSPYGYHDSIRTGSAGAEADHVAKVQTVMGRSIVNFARRGFRSGLWSSVERAAQGNPNMIGVTKAIGLKMDAAFLASWQPNLGRGIVAATQEGTTRSVLRQERLGTAIMQQAAASNTYEPARAAIQEQLGGARMVATLTESQVDRAGPDHLVANAAADVSLSGASPRIPTTIIVVASLLLASLFSAGLFWSRTVPGGHANGLASIGSAVLVRSKPA